MGEEGHPLNFWITIHWPPRVDEANGPGMETRVWVPHGRRHAANNMQPGDYIIIYESRSGRAEIRTQPDGTKIRVPCQIGREGMVCHGKVDGAMTEDTNVQPSQYADGSEIRWSWAATQEGDEA